MKQEFIIKQNNPNLLLFFAGWGMDKYPFEKYIPHNHDFLICYDYTTLEFDSNLIGNYKSIDVIAWSMGVWAASQAIGSMGLEVNSAIAINGTTHPIDDSKGIPQAIFQGTLDGLNDATLKKFQRRMCGSTESYKLFIEVAPHRTIESLKAELKAIGELYQSHPAQTIDWSEAYIGLNDKIFPATNQQTSWQGINHISSGEENHYDESLFRHYLETIWTKS